MLQRTIHEANKSGELISPAEVLKGSKLLSNGLTLFNNAPTTRYSLTQAGDLNTPASCLLR